MKKRLKKDEGALVVEASYVFPIVVLVLCMLIYAGNAYLLKCEVEAIVAEEAIKGAAYCGDPVSYALETGDGTLPGYSSIEVQPYRFLIGGMNDYETAIQNNIKKRLKNMSGGLFNNMEISSTKINGPNFNNAFIYSTFSVEVTYDVKLPVRIWGEEPVMMHLSSLVDMPVTDSVELIRNIDMIEDYMQRSKTIQAGLDKIEELIDKVKEYKDKE